MAWLRRLRRVTLWTFAAILAVDVVFAIGLTVLECTVSNSPRVADSLQAHSTAPHRLTHYDQGAASFQRRLELIESATKSIELEFFIYNVDEAARLITQALLKKARAGVRVRLLVDFSAPVFELTPAYAKVLREAGVEVRYYNTNSIYRLVSIQHRSHRRARIWAAATRGGVCTRSAA